MFLRIFFSVKFLENPNIKFTKGIQFQKESFNEYSVKVRILL